MSIVNTNLKKSIAFSALESILSHYSEKELKEMAKTKDYDLAVYYFAVDIAFEFSKNNTDLAGCLLDHIADKNEIVRRNHIYLNK